jgi:hypothetical protein
MIRYFLFLSYVVVLISPCFGSEFSSFGFDEKPFTAKSCQNKNSFSQSKVVTGHNSEIINPNKHNYNQNNNN